MKKVSIPEQGHNESGISEIQRERESEKEKEREKKGRDEGRFSEVDE